MRVYGGDKGVYGANTDGLWEPWGQGVLWEQGAMGDRDCGGAMRGSGRSGLVLGGGL
jgi:hypothetical protein